MKERTRRIGENEAIFRAVNEQVQGITTTLSSATETMSIVCECGQGDCTEQFPIEPAEYSRVREDGTLFLVKPGHELPDTEKVVEEGDGYFIVQKDPGEPAELAEALDARS
jgi:hypothetical protein